MHDWDFLLEAVRATAPSRSGEGNNLADFEFIPVCENEFLPGGVTRMRDQLAQPEPGAAAKARRP